MVLLLFFNTIFSIVLRSRGLRIDYMHSNDPGPKNKTIQSPQQKFTYKTINKSYYILNLFNKLRNKS